ncbi:DNA-binding transcriptional regulator, HxlR family [Mycolicibacterium rutilum]|uniref:DNA-binding transcriptional regulator, HxlR family n=1 Tax=Mycolicibacterium rutilum TaxID=370526 RepID=A0A1H6IV59_MYCRU|nr:helix-turn-helix domain-containing protein [Mycolicibacterium rutilum]SEH50589.1 DNA-binding transcriptional regulator, HxlR family [Mycolicibacterium rutilum]
MTGPEDLSHRFEVESVERTLALVGERWTFVILREIFLGVRRFGQLVRNLNIPRPTLAARLRSLVDNGLLVRVPYAQDPERFEYRLTDSGRDLFPAVVTLMQWGDKHLPVPEGPPLVLRHQSCGQIVEARLLCSNCNQELNARNVTPEPGPGFGGAQD